MQLYVRRKETVPPYRRFRKFVSVGTLMTCAFEDPDAGIGLIFGTGSNACYIEDLSKAEMWVVGQSEERPKTGILNCEWGAFGNGGCLDDVGIR